MIRKIDQAWNPISLGDQTPGTAWDAFHQHSLGEPAPASSLRGLETSQGAQYHSCHSCAAAPEVTHSWG